MNARAHATEILRRRGAEASAAAEAATARDCAALREKKKKLPTHRTDVNTEMFQ